ncbi:acetoacetate--CoA ligase [Hoyosella subflava]|uniref:Putative acyl-CoA synthetase n=1 Tax=Hoyosella subflava (strain DSM 45089 / JCM 17490 / NBRC 109087 / DQS3-9A1) TaxID=443218 RepID=F6EM00_HOYSD|nr:acetoacetate--CoA ligase [Hoyosella subflava]AEF42781.1 Putative acyl-CoA synthetase [Hoyosella subflava DQS3-9A1]
MSTSESQELWTPAPGDIEFAQVTEFTRFAGRFGAPSGDYDALWSWSVADVGRFWEVVWDYFGVGERRGPALTDDRMPGARWFPEARLNYADVVLRAGRGDQVAMLDLAEDEPTREVTWQRLRFEVASLAQSLRDAGVGRGDRVVGYLPNIPEAIVGLLATASIGAVWAGCGQDYSPPAAVTRLGQLEPKVLIAADGYRYGGKAHDKREAVNEVADALPSVSMTILVQRLGLDVPEGMEAWDAVTSSPAELTAEPVEFDHPLWVVFSSGTTGLPKGIVHGHGGVVLEHAKHLSLHLDLGPDDRFFWFTSPSWMMWNFLVAGLIVGSVIVTYDGSPAHPGADGLWKLAADNAVTFLGTSPGYVLACSKAGVVPRDSYDLSVLRSVGITGATLPASSAQWLADNVGAQKQICSISGGTDVVSAFVGPVRTVPVWAGEISRPCLGVALDAFDGAGKSARGDVGELVITQPMPSMPVSFWNDPSGEKYRDAYFSDFPGVWRHGDWITITERGSIEMHGRSDSTLNRHGIRMGSADIYQAVEQVEEVTEALVLGIELPDGGYWMPLFVELADGVELTEELVSKIRTVIRDELSPRHVPDEVIAAPGIPHTRTGKKLEVPLKKILQGADPAKAVDRSAIDSPDLLDWYATHKR